MKNFLDLDSPLIRFLSAVADLVLLNLLWLACCVPVFTIGPSCTAMCYSARRIANRESPVVSRTFFRAFKANFKQSFLVSLVLLVPITVAASSFLLLLSGQLDQVGWLKLVYGVVILFCCFFCTYAYPLLAYFDNTFKNTVRNIVMMPMANPLLALLVTALDLLPLLLLLLSTELFARCLIFWIAIGAALTAVGKMKLLDGLFRRFVTPGPGPEAAKDGVEKPDGEV